ncbi:MAG: hypothetical protein KGH63_00135 [Candidatus Micrarchaeota archaeon]|nr:hypothetical protein [Candidatus Micrarchaeota archaeon]
MAFTSMADLKFCAHYPFSEEARAWVREQGLSFTSSLVEKGEARLRAALKEGELKLLGTSLESELRDEVSSYAAARVILSAWKNRYAAGRLAVAEAKRANAYLHSPEDRRAGYAEKLASLMALDFQSTALASEEKDASYTLPFWQYLLYSPRSVDYKLTNRQMGGGRVTLTDHQRIRIIEEAIRKRLDGAPLPKSPPDLEKELKASIARLEVYLPRENLAPTKIDQKDFPPCIRKLIDDLRASINVPHTGRLALAIYLTKAGLTDEQIVQLFTTAPDFNAETTRYQVAYIRKKAYSMQSCATMDTYGLCIATCKCGNPANYREERHGRNARESMAKRNDEEKTTGV